MTEWIYGFRDRDVQRIARALRLSEGKPTDLTPPRSRPYRRAPAKLDVPFDACYLIDEALPDDADAGTSMTNTEAAGSEQRLLLHLARPVKVAYVGYGAEILNLIIDEDVSVDWTKPSTFLPYNPVLGPRHWEARPITTDFAAAPTWNEVAAGTPTVEDLPSMSKRVTDSGEQFTEITVPADADSGTWTWRWSAEGIILSPVYSEGSAWTGKTIYGVELRSVEPVLRDGYLTAKSAWMKTLAVSGYSRLFPRGYAAAFPPTWV